MSCTAIQFLLGCCGISFSGRGKHTLEHFSSLKIEPNLVLQRGSALLFQENQLLFAAASIVTCVTANAA